MTRTTLLSGPWPDAEGRKEACADPASVLASLPDDTHCSVLVGTGDFTLGELRQALARTTPMFLTTKQAAERWGYSSESWAKWAKEDLLEGAWQDVDGGPWHLPSESCEDHVDHLRQQSATQKRRRFRGPRKR